MLLLLCYCKISIEMADVPEASSRRARQWRMFALEFIPLQRARHCRAVGAEAPP